MGCFGRYRIPLPSHEELRRLFDYDPNSGHLFWRERAECPVQWNGKWIGRKAGTPDSNGYIEVRINRQAYCAHRLIWKWLYGTEPSDIDHADRDKTNNAQANLRACSHFENTRNAAGWARKALPKGVHQRESGHFRAIICVERRNQHLGTFKTAEEAAAAYAAAAARLHGDFARIA
jgi:hypothetical protein